MMGKSTKHVFIRGTHRFFGTLVGLVLTWAITVFHPSLLIIAIYIVIAQILIEYFVARNYGIANIFITILTILLAEKGYEIQQNVNSFILFRITDIVIGSLIGLVGGTVLYNWHFRSMWLRLGKKIQNKQIGR